jgi:CO dehydrogenase maturation factor
MGHEAEPGRSPREEWLLETLARQVAVVDRLRRAAEAAPDELASCAGWLAVQRQAARYLRNLAAWSSARGFQHCASELVAHRSALEAFRQAAGSAVHASDEEVRRWADHGLGLRVAVVGKGGAGKTVIAGTLARLLGRRGRKVVAADLDTNPGLAFSLGMPPTDAGLAREAIERHEGAAYGWQLARGLAPIDVVDRFSSAAPDGVRYLGVGKIGEPEKEAAKRSVVAVLQVLLGLGDHDWDVVGDLEAGTTTPFERYHGFAERALVVVGPAWRSALTARRLIGLMGDVATTVVANRFRDEPDHPGLAPVVRIPFDPAVAEAERLGIAPLDHCPDAPAVRAIDELADRLTAQEVTV